MNKLLCLVLVGFWASLADAASSANRFTNLDENDPFCPSLAFPKLVTPQWIGETNVEAAIILAIDDMRDTAKYETWLRPVLNRLKQIDGRAALSIFANTLDATNAQAQVWLKEGLSLEVHTLTHPCPFFAKSNFLASADTYYGCVDLLSGITNGAPVAFRMPCCDSINSPSPRFYAELFNPLSPEKHFLQMDSSVMNILTAADPAIPKNLVVDPDGKDRFRKYLPFPSFTTTIENYPYPYVIGKLCWEFPPTVPSDWEAQHIHGATNPVTVADWKAALDATVLKQGTFTFIFHPHGWIRPDQIVEFIDYAADRYGSKVKFLNFKEALERLNKNLLGGQSLRDLAGNDNGVRLADLNNDGFLDVMVGNRQSRQTRIWDPQTRQWHDHNFPVELVEQNTKGNNDRGVHFGVLNESGTDIPFFLQRDEASFAAWRFQNSQWVEQPNLLLGFELKGHPILTRKSGIDQGVRLRDINNDGRSEVIIANSTESGAMGWDSEANRWKELSYVFPREAAFVDDHGADNGLRFVDLNGDGFDDVIQSNPNGFLLNLFVPELYLGFQPGWSRDVMRGKPGDRGALPLIVRGGEHPNNGVWFHSGQMWVQNEDTALLPDIVDRRSYSQLLAGLQPPPLTPDQALQSFQLAPSFSIELVASEPLVKDPIAFEWGADGKLWVVEMGDYPLGLDGKGKAGGTVLFLEDTDGDGKYDKSTVFLENLSFPNGIFPWGKGVVVSTSPEIIYAEDTDGDGKADLKRTLFTGFHPGNQQHRLNGFDYGLDNLLYGANGESGGEVLPNLETFPKLSSNKPVSLRSHDFRFDPDIGFFEAIAGTTQYGRHRDDWGNWFGNNNPSWLWHYYADEKYLRRNPNLPIPSLRRYLANYHDGTRVYPISHTIQRFNDIGMVNHVTSGNSAMPYRDELFGPDFTSSIFISEPVHNVVHREVLEPDGVTFTSHRAEGEETREFLSSTDNWFRPTMLKTGPDGALYIADMYRLVLEHPEWIPADTQKSLDLRAGADKGRIYRVYPTEAKLRTIPRLDKLNTLQLVESLNSANGWQRDTAQRLLVHSKDTAAVPALERLLKESKNPKVRLQTLATLEGLKKITPESIQIALSGEPHVRAFAIKLSEPYLSVTNGAEAAVLDRVLELASDADIFVRYQVALTLGETSDPRAADALLKISRRDPGNKEIRLAVLSSALPHLPALLDRVIPGQSSPPVDSALFKDLVQMALARQETFRFAPLLEKIAAIKTPYFQYMTLAAFNDALGAKNSSFALLKRDSTPDLQQAIARVGPVIGRARAMLNDPKTGAAERRSILPILAGSTSDPDLQTLVETFNRASDESLRAEAARLLTTSPNPHVATLLLASWKSVVPASRPAMIALLASRESTAAQLLDAIERGNISSGEIGRSEQQKLLSHHTESIRDRANKLFGTPNKDREKVLRDYANVPLLKPDSNRGAELFRANCAQCHRLKDQGTQVGPDLTIVQEKSTETLIEAILDPNRAFEAPYVSYTLATHDGQEFTGLIANESDNSVTLRAPNVPDKTLLRQDIQSLRSSGVSLMPEGFEKILNPQALADLIAYIRSK
ncbi:MAG: putative rane-bound dehydrogenase [Verrucomicrobiales bacterium]|nr:putative rane-bound dehydrogenase [Verrucomicrobiales bacterium]